MNGLARALLGSAVPWIVFISPGLSEDDSPARLGQSSGTVAVQADESSAWSVLRSLAEDPLPERCRLRTAAFGEASTLVRLGEASLQIAEDTRLDLDSKVRRAAVENGCVFLSASGQEKAAWTLRAGDFACRLEKDSAAELRVAASGLVRLAVTRGSAEVTISKPAGKPQRIAAGKGASWSSTGAKLDTEALSDEQRQRIEAWTSTVPQSQGLGQLLVGDAQSESPVRLNIARYHVNVVLQPPVALVQIDQSFYNPYSQQEEGTFVFNLPRGASVSRFAMYVTPGELIEGELIERKRASQVYETIVRQRRDPAILEQIGDNLFRMRVFPIFARDTKRILLDYTVPLECDGGECRFRLPLLSDLEPIWDFRMSGTILGPTRLDSVASETHAGVQFTDETGADGAIRFDFRQHDYKPESDFALRFSQERAPSREATVRSYVAQPLPLPWDRRGRATERFFRNLPE
ncbi:MAG: hypothetical protein HQ582_34065, partial [Planctomycetes bacterium]|nr:hypothetical protein [Planctomycetota bacterium]